MPVKLPGNKAITRGQGNDEPIKSRRAGRRSAQILSGNSAFISRHRQRVPLQAEVPVAGRALRAADSHPRLCDGFTGGATPVVARHAAEGWDRRLIHGRRAASAGSISGGASSWLALHKGCVRPSMFDPKAGGLSPIPHHLSLARQLVRFL